MSSTMEGIKSSYNGKSRSLVLIRKNVCLSAEGAQRLEEKTRQQAASELWRTARSKRVTASLFGRVYKMRDATSREPVVAQIMASRHVTTAAMQWGKDNEGQALRVYSARTGRAVKSCGLIIDPQCCWLGASPDGLVEDKLERYQEGIVEVKCPYLERNGCVADVAQRPSGSFLKKGKDGSLSLNRRHDYFFQVQGQLALSHRQWCDFIVYTSSDFFTERIYFDQGLWNDMFPRLTKFFLIISCLNFNFFQL